MKIKDLVKTAVEQPSGYDIETEVLTNNGWKLLKDIDINEDLILSINAETKEMMYNKAIDKIVQYYEGPMYNFKSNGMDLMLTPNQKMFSYYKNCKNEIVLNKILEAKDIKKSYLNPLVGYSYKYNLETGLTFTLPETEQLEQASRREIVVPEKEIDLGNWLEFFGFYLADGCYRDHINVLGKRDYTISIAQNKEGLDYVLKLIENIGFKPRYRKKEKKRDNCYSIEIYSKQLWLYLEQFGRSSDKYIPREFLNLPKKYLKRLFKGFTNGDSHLEGDTLVITSRSKAIVEGMQEIILKLYGNIANFRTCYGKYKGEEYIMYMLRFKENKQSRNNVKYREPTIVPYKDNVYSLTLENNNIILVRRNNEALCAACNLEKSNK